MALKDIHLGGHAPPSAGENRPLVMDAPRALPSSGAVTGEQVWRLRVAEAEKRAADLAQEVEDYRSTQEACDAEAKRLAARILELEEEARVLEDTLTTERKISELALGDLRKAEARLAEAELALRAETGARS